MSEVLFKSKLSPPKSPARKALTQAHADLKAAQRTLDGLDAAIAYDGNATRAVNKADVALEQAEADLVRAQSEHTEALINPAVKLAMTMQEARSRVEAAKTMLADAEQARKTLRSRQATVEADLAKARTEVETCALAVLRDHWAPRIDQFLVELNDLHQQIAERGQTLARLISLDIIPCHGPSAPVGIIELVSRYFDTPIASWPMSRRPMASTAALNHAVAALKTNAAAPLES